MDAIGWSESNSEMFDASDIMSPNLTLLADPPGTWNNGGRAGQRRISRFSSGTTTGRISRRDGDRRPRRLWPLGSQWCATASYPAYHKRQYG